MRTEGWSHQRKLIGAYNNASVGKVALLFAENKLHTTQYRLVMSKRPSGSTMYREDKQRGYL